MMDPVFLGALAIALLWVGAFTAHMARKKEALPKALPKPDEPTLLTPQQIEVWLNRDEVWELIEAAAVYKLDPRDRAVATHLNGRVQLNPLRVRCVITLDRPSVTNKPTLRVVN